MSHSNSVVIDGPNVWSTAIWFDTDSSLGLKTGYVGDTTDFTIKFEVVINIAGLVLIPTLEGSSAIPKASLFTGDTVIEVSTSN